MSGKVDGLVLPTDFRATSEAQNVVIPGGSYFPGGPWYPGVPKPLEATGLSKAEALALIKEHDLPFKEAKADPLESAAEVEYAEPAPEPAVEETP